MASISIRNVSKSFGIYPVLQGLDLDIADGEFVSFLGPSGCGKSTLLFCIAGLEELTAGTIHLGERDMGRIPPRDRNIALVFQDYALYPHMRVRENIAFPLQQQGLPSETVRKQVAWAAELLGLEALLDRSPAELSGGQRQRVAVGRAIVRNPAALLMDEPLSNLDASLRVRMRTEIKRLQKELGLTVIFVTHDQEEAMDLADRVAVLHAGRIEQIGAPQALNEAPASAFVFDFLGDSNRAPCRIDGARAVFDGFSAPLAAPGDAGGATTAWFRPHETLVERAGEGWPVTVTGRLIKSAIVRLECRGVGGAIFEVDFPKDAPQADLIVGAEARLKPKRVFAFADSSRD